jgi:type I protein arginine methyltransferase
VNEAAMLADSHFGIHEEMLKDTHRTRTYMNSIVRNKHLFEGKVVLDVGCGTGILSLFAAKAGASRVIGIDLSRIAEQAKQIVALNSYDKVVTIIRGKVEEVELPDGIEKVDIIISEWMGYCGGLYESMLPTVLYARDKWLNEGGALFPDKAIIYVNAIEDADYKEEKVGFWDNVYGFNMEPIKSLVMMEPLVDTVDPEQLIATDSKLIELDLYTVTKKDLDFEAPFELTFARNDMCHAIVMHFDTIFGRCHKPLVLTTSPRATPTHWKQTVFYMEDELRVFAGEKLTGKIKFRANAKNPRDLDVSIEYSFAGKASKVSRTQEYRMR